MVEVAQVIQRNESTVEGKERVRFTSGKIDNEKEILKGEYDVVNRKYIKNGVVRIVESSSSSPSFAYDINKNIEIVNNLLLQLDRTEAEAKLENNSQTYKAQKSNQTNSISADEACKLVSKIYGLQFQYECSGKMSPGLKIDRKPSEEY